MEVSRNVLLLRRKSWARVEVDGSSPWPHLERLLAIIVLSTSSFNCSACLPPAKSNLQKINKLGTASLTTYLVCTISSLPSLYTIAEYCPSCSVGGGKIHRRVALPVCERIRCDSRARTYALQIKHRADSKWRAGAWIKTRTHLAAGFITTLVESVRAVVSAMVRTPMYVGLHRAP